MSYVLTPSRIGREAARNLKFKSRLKKGEEPGDDYAISRHTVEIPLWKATYLDDPKTSLGATAKPGDVLVLEPKVDVSVLNRVIEIEAHKDLGKHGVVSTSRTYRHGETVGRIVWTCTAAFDLKKLPWLYEIYIHDQSIK